MKQYILIFALILIYTPSLWAQIKCDYTDLDNNYYDFGPLANVKVSEKISDGGYDFYVTPCASTPKNAQTQPTCGKPNSPSIQLLAGTDECLAYLGDIATQQWSKDPSNGHIVLTYTNGQPCDGISRQAKISFECDPDSESDFYEAKTDYPVKCAYELEWKTKHACPGFATKAGGLSGGAWFLIFLLGIILPIYLIGGVIYNVRKGATGIELIPNIAFWKDLPALIKDGCSFTFGRICGRGGYQQV